ncbi:MAG: hypothetical protein ONB12_13785 [candidate division KSB1 bacterium]|nr:hypothetical protein [candidate division KSB1 bacterium]
MKIARSEWNRFVFVYCFFNNFFAQYLAALEAEYTPLLAAVDAQIKTLEQDIRAAVLQHGAPVRGGRIQAVYIRGRTTWDTKGLLRYAMRYPDVLTYRKESAPTVQLRMIKEVSAGVAVS